MVCSSQNIDQFQEIWALSALCELWRQLLSLQIRRNSSMVFFCLIPVHTFLFLSAILVCVIISASGFTNSATLNQHESSSLKTALYLDFQATWTFRLRLDAVFASSGCMSLHLLINDTLCLRCLCGLGDFTYQWSLRSRISHWRTICYDTQIWAQSSESKHARYCEFCIYLISWKLP